MKLDYNCTGADRKKLVAAIAEHLGQKAKYLGAPSFAYQVDCITIDKNGVLQMNDMADPGWVEAIEKKLAESGFECVSFSYDNPQPEPTQEEAHEDSSDADFTGICISMPRSLFTEQNLANLHSIVEAKGSLIRKALGAANLPIEVSDHKVSFPWFQADPTPDELKAELPLKFRRRIFRAALNSSPMKPSRRRKQRNAYFSLSVSFSFAVTRF